MTLRLSIIAGIESRPTNKTFSQAGFPYPAIDPFRYSSSKRYMAGLTGALLMTNSPSVAQLAALSACSILMTQLTESGPVTVQSCWPSFNVDAVMVSNVPESPPWRDREILT